MKLNSYKVVVTILAVGILFTIIAPLLFTHFYLADWLVLDKKEFANIGSTIGGITAPIIGLLTAFLLYITFKEQRDANRMNSISNSIQQLDNFLFQNRLLEYSEEVEKILNSNNSSTSTCVDKLANQQFFNTLRATSLIYTIVSEIDQNTNGTEYFKVNMVSIINQLKDSQAYKAIEKTGTFTQKGNNNYSPQRCIEDAEEITLNWKVYIPYSKNIDPLKS